MVYIFLADGFEEVEAITPIDYIRRCEIEINSVGIGSKIIKGFHNIAIETDITIEDFKFDSNVDMIVLPGGLVGTENLRVNEIVRESLVLARKTSSIAAICAAPIILSDLKLLDGVAACCYPGMEKYLNGANVLNDSVVVCENVITAQSAGVAQQFAFEIVKYLKGEYKASKLKEQVRWTI